MALQEKPKGAGISKPISSDLCLQALDRVPVVALIMDRQARITYVNDAFCRALGVRREDALEDAFLDRFVAEQLTESFRSDLARLVERRRTLPDRQTRLTSADGRRLVFRWQAEYLFDADGEVTGIACYGRDVTRHQRTERSGRRNETLVPAVLRDLSQTGRHLRALRSIREIADSVGTMEDVGTFLESVTQQALSLLQVRSAAVLLTDDDGAVCLTIGASSPDGLGLDWSGRPLSEARDALLKTLDCRFHRTLDLEGGM